ncbi:MAG: Tfp pilus assembly protein FimT/FimU [Verrucomicrobium sp.]
MIVSRMLAGANGFTKNETLSVNDSHANAGSYNVTAADTRLGSLGSIGSVRAGHASQHFAQGRNTVGGSNLMKNTTPNFAHAVASAFTLIEMVVVIGVIGILFAVMWPALGGMLGGQNMTKSITDISGLLEQARSHAMAKNTYVYVGLVETDETKESPEAAVQGGNLTAAVMMSTTGVRPLTADGAELAALSPLYRFENLKLESIGTEGNLARKSGDDVINLAGTTTKGFAKFTWNANGGTGLTFEKVIEFDPRGVVRFSSKNSIEGWIEIPLQSARSKDNSVAALQVDGVTGAVRIYRP